MTRYRTIVADPPWHYDRTGVSFVAPEGGEFRSSTIPYDSMSLGAIADLPVREWAARDAHLYLWTTQRYIRDAYWIAEAWGFRPVRLLTWCKEPIGMAPGGTFSSTSEFILFARGGSLKATAKVDRSWFDWPRQQRHSAKPEAFLDLVEQVSPGPYLELFARRQRLGWDTWGNEALEHVDLDGSAA